MTTMDVASVPPALVRSGRIELWLETRLPDEAARLEILNDLTVKVPEEARPASLQQLASITDGLTGADLRRLMEDGKILYAYDKARGVPLKTLDEYYAKAVETIRSNKEKYADAEERARERANGGSRSTDPYRRYAMRAMSKALSGDDDD
jgi:transitional endoplasmic reticulum ATPase